MAFANVRGMHPRCGIGGAVLRRLRSEERGQGLSELLTTIAILAIVLTGLTSTFVSASHAQLDMTDRFTAQQQSLMSLDMLRREVHCASAVSDTSGGALVSGSSYTGIRLTLGSYCRTGTGSVTWCTVANGARFDLYRIAGTSCGTSGKKWAGYLTHGDVFGVPVPAPATVHLPTLHVSLIVNPRTSTSIGTYSLVDDIVLRNGIRQ